jgi:hypothetical protein
MTTPIEQLGFIDEIDRRQNQVLDQLDKLNDRVEALIEQYLPAKKSSGTETQPEG